MNDSPKIDKWLIEWFKERNQGSLPETDKPLEEENYFELGLIDSFGILELITEIETHYGIGLTQDHFEQRRFSTLKGLAEIIREEASENGTL